MTHEVHPEPHVTRHREIETNLDRPPLVSWGAILGGLVCVVSLSWLLYLLGLALGVSVADVTDGQAIGNGLGIGATIWMIISAMLVFFIGSILAARLSGKVDSTVGMLHGLVLWGIGTALMVVMSYYGVSTLLQTGTAMIGATASVVGDMASVAAATTSSATGAVSSAADTRLAENIQARLKRRAMTIVARSTADDAEGVTKAEVRDAIESLDQETLKTIAEDIAAGENTSAAEALANATNLSASEVREIIESVSGQFQEKIGTADNNTGLSADIANSLQSQTADVLSELDSGGGPRVTERRIESALNDLSAANLQTVAVRLIEGDVQGAKDFLANQTSLTKRQINDIVEGVNADVSRTINAYQAEAAEAVEIASDYAQAVLWVVFVATAMSLVVSILGGMLGAETSRTLYVEERKAIDNSIVA